MSRERPVDAFNIELLALSGVEYIHRCSHAQVGRTRLWVELCEQLGRYVDAHRPQYMPYKKTRQAIHLRIMKSPSHPLHSVIDEFFDFIEKEAQLHEIKELDHLDSVKLCKKIKEHPLLS